MQSNFFRAEEEEDKEDKKEAMTSIFFF